MNNAPAIHLQLNQAAMLSASARRRSPNGVWSTVIGGAALRWPADGLRLSTVLVRPLRDDGRAHAEGDYDVALAVSLHEFWPTIMTLSRKLKEFHQLNVHN